MTPLLRLRGVDVAPLGVAAPVIGGIDLDIGRGECVALVGPSGSGKTTLLRTLGGAIPSLRGSILFDGEELTGLARAALRRARMRIGMIAQQHDLVEPLRVGSNVMAGALGRWSNARALRFLVRATGDELAEAEAALAAVGLQGKLRRRTSALSGGEQQRVAIARVLVQEPALLLADEPVASLDPATAASVLRLLTELARERGMALVCALHQPELAERFCDRVLVVREGRLAA